MRWPSGSALLTSPSSAPTPVTRQPKPATSTYWPASTAPWSRSTFSRHSAISGTCWTTPLTWLLRKPCAGRCAPTSKRRPSTSQGMGCACLTQVVGPPREWRHYIEDMIESCRRVLEYTSGLDQTVFVTDIRTRYAVMHNLTLIGKAATNVPNTVRDADCAQAESVVGGARPFSNSSHIAIEVIASSRAPDGEDSTGLAAQPARTGRRRPAYPRGPRSRRTPPGLPCRPAAPRWCRGPSGAPSRRR